MKIATNQNYCSYLHFDCLVNDKALRNVSISKSYDLVFIKRFAGIKYDMFFILKFS